jgi:hypothetical protein
VSSSDPSLFANQRLFSFTSDYDRHVLEKSAALEQCFVLLSVYRSEG